MDMKSLKKTLKFNKGMTGASISQISKPIYKSVKLFIPYNDISAVYTTKNQIKKKKKTATKISQRKQDKMERIVANSSVLPGDLQRLLDRIE